MAKEDRIREAWREARNRKCKWAFPDGNGNGVGGGEVVVGKGGGGGVVITRGVSSKSL
jgi:hypothetical protein